MIKSSCHLSPKSKFVTVNKTLRREKISLNIWNVYVFLTFNVQK